MPSCTSLIRLLRRRLVLGLIFALSLTYCAFSLLRNEKAERGLPNLDNNFDMDFMMINDNNEDMIPDDNLLEELRASDKSPLWQIEILDQVADNAGNIDASNLNESDAYNQSCRNSIQGRGLIVDDHGVVCSRHEVQSNGCCAIEQKQSSKNEESFITRKEKYSCKTCNSQGCCTIYEYCVSCCLHPDKQIRGRKDLSSNSAKVQKNVGRTAVHFQICLAACRTSSSSVRRDNTYKDALAKHCYIPQRYRRNINSLNNNGDSPAVVVTSSSVVMLLSSSSESYSYLFNPTLSLVLC
ncbi:UPF0454 protein C12orf49 like protein [Trachymyrmex septentrionalis]|uniref:SREBP regulating gene protein n=1 Tax=Trachymyrmex septentrionalis TaxID=34720 RepID=A0A195FZB1_9HYME|nr:UPF0454 protein C12orf49 like protein [Trachymyrmex septentrionalis]